MKKIGASGGETDNLDTQAEYDAAMKLLRETARASTQAYQSLFRHGAVLERDGAKYSLVPTQDRLVEIDADGKSLEIHFDVRGCFAFSPGYIQQILTSEQGDIFVLFDTGSVGRVVNTKSKRKIQFVAFDEEKSGAGNIQHSSLQLEDGQVYLSSPDGRKITLSDKKTNPRITSCPGL